MPFARPGEADDDQAAFEPVGLRPDDPDRTLEYLSQAAWSLWNSRANRYGFLPAVPWHDQLARHRGRVYPLHLYYIARALTHQAPWTVRLDPDLWRDRKVLSTDDECRLGLEDVTTVGPWVEHLADTDPMLMAIWLDGEGHFWVARLRGDDIRQNVVIALPFGRDAADVLDWVEHPYVIG